MRRRAKAIALSAENLGYSLFLPLAVGMLIVLFAVSFAMAEPRSDVIAAHEVTTGDLSLVIEGGLASDAMPTDTFISSRPLAPPRYPDRYEFYHRYDHGLTSRSNPLDDGVN